MTDPLGAITAHLADTHFDKYKNNASLESAQSKRRKEALERTKKCREAQIERTRKLFQDSDEEFDSSEENSPEKEKENPVQNYVNNNVFGRNNSGENQNPVEGETTDSAFLNFRQQKYDPQQQQRRYEKKIYKKYENRIMTNEWLLERPVDLPDWLYIPCPMGRRSLVVAANGETIAYSQKGFQRCKFQSILPNGNYSFNFNEDNYKDSSKQTILDCVINFESKTCYVLDLVKWNGYNYFNGSAQFRHSWKEQMIEDEVNCKLYKDLDKAVEKERQAQGMDVSNDTSEKRNSFSLNQLYSYKKFWKIVPMRAFPCDELNQDRKIIENMSEIQKMAMEKDNNKSETVDNNSGAHFYNKNPWKLDGILVYHNEGIYYPAGEQDETYPLFGWLKQDRMKELINSYAEFIDDTPQWVKNKMERRFKNKSGNNTHNTNNRINTGYSPKHNGQINSNNTERFASSITKANERGFRVPETPVYLKNYEVTEEKSHQW